MAQRAKEVDNRIFRVVGWRHAPPTPGSFRLRCANNNSQAQIADWVRIFNPSTHGGAAPEQTVGFVFADSAGWLHCANPGFQQIWFRKKRLFFAFCADLVLSGSNSAPCAAALIPRNHQLGSFLQTPPDGFVAQTPDSSKSGFAKNAFSSPFALTRCRAGILASEAASSRLSPRLAL